MDRYGRDKIFYAISGKKDNALELLNNLENVDFQDKAGYSYLHIAVQSNFLEAVNKLLKLNCRIDIKDQYGRTPLMIAFSSWNGEEDDVIQVLLAAGANINETADSGVSCLELAKMKGYSGLVL
ncbi:MAG: ankyrin repeat domain-containing protein [Eubacterium sp.]|nr:ankyrin repeat domain-containing protein [Eubacterium sp.]